MSVAAVHLERALRTDGWMELDELTWLAEHAAQASKIVEVGSWRGRSARALADHTTGTVWCVDPWTGMQAPVIPDTLNGGVVVLRKPLRQDIFAQFVENLSDHLATGRVQVLPVRSRIALHVLRVLAPFDLVFLDGDHTYPSIVSEIREFRPLVRPGGILAGHDYGERWPDVKKAVDVLVPDRQILNRIWWTRV